MMHLYKSTTPKILISTLIGFLFLCASTNSYAQTTYHVNANTPCTTGCDGTTWAKAFESLQEAFYTGIEGDKVWVAEGTYLPSLDFSGSPFPDDNRSKTFYITKDLKVYGGFPNTGTPTMGDRDWEMHQTILSGDFNGDDVPISNKEDADFPAQNNGENAYNVVVTTDLSTACLVDGFVIEGGNAILYGGGWLNDGSYGEESSPTIQNCLFQNNLADDKGGALYNIGWNGVSSPILINCIFQNNRANYNGGALYNDGSDGVSSPILTNCSFQNNQAEFGGALYNIGSDGVSSPILTNCIFQNNQAIAGGALSNTGYKGTSSPTLTNCIFQNNQADSGGALSNVGIEGASSPILTNCSFQKNQADLGGALHSYSIEGTSSPTLINCIFWQNRKEGQGSSIYNLEANPTISYTLLEETFCPFGATCESTVIYAQNPLFVDAENGDLSLQLCSPAINVGDGNATTSTNSTTEDLASEARFYNEGIIDMGAYEYQDNPSISPSVSISGELQYCASDLTTTLDAGSWTSYQWSNDETTQIIAATEGTYTVTVTNSNGCTGTDQVTVIENANPSPVIAGNLEYCTSNNLTILSAGNWTSYKWSNGATSQGIGVSEGTYTVTVTNSNDCTGTDVVIVTGIENPSPSITGDLEYCASDNFTVLDVGTWTTYKWSNDETTQTIAATEGTYTVIVTNTSGCTGTVQIDVTENANPTPIIRGILKYCASDHFTTLDAGNWTSYQWSNGETSRIIEANAGTYTVTVTNSNDCTGTDEVTVTENANPIPSITGDFAYCRGRQATLDAGVWETYAWSNGETGQSFSTTSIGVYTVTITNQEGCTGTAMAEVSATPCLAEAGILTTNQNTICAGEALEVSSTGNQTDTNYRHYFFVYLQDNLGNTLYQKSSIANYGTGTATASFGGLSAGDYLVCSYNECKDCLPNPSPVIFTTPMNDIYQTGTIQDGCFDIECVEVSVPEAFEPHASGTGIVAENNAAGQTIFVAEVCGGTMPYSIEFESAGGFATVNDYPSPMAGCLKYQVLYVPEAEWTLTVTDSNGCNNETVVFTNEGLIDESVPQIISHEIGVESCPGYADGSISIEVEGGSDHCNEYTYEWSGPNSFVSTALGAVTGNEVTGLASGKYDVTVTDCEGETTTMENINVSRKTRGRGRGRGGCKTVEGEENKIFDVYPNPFGQQTSIEFLLAESSKVWLSIYSIDGRKVVELLKGEEVEGELLQRMDFDAEQLQNGVYILQLETETGERLHTKLLISK